MHSLRAPLRHRRVASALALAVATALLVIVNTALPATAEQPDCEPPDELVLKDVVNSEGETVQVWVCEDRGGGGGDGDSGHECDTQLIVNVMNTDPSFVGVRDKYGDPYCGGPGKACATKVPSSIPEDSWPPDRPREDAIYSFTACTTDGVEWDGTWSWYVPPEPPLLDQAELAYSRLRAEPFALTFNPAQMSFVGAKTYFWADISGTGELDSQAFSVIATATPSHLTVDPGDGNGSMNCGWATSKTDQCVKKYPQASVNGSATGVGGEPAFSAEATLTYDVAFTVNGAPLPADVLAQLPDTLDSPPQTAAVPVGEVQVIVD